MSSHAILSPSSASRWLACTPSALLESKMPRTSNAAADEGTLAHHLSEILLIQYLRKIGFAGYVDYPSKAKELEEIQKHKFYCEGMLKYCYQYRDFVIEALNTAIAEDENAEIFLEVKVDLTSFVPEGFGTSDVAIVSSKRIHIIDLKYGRNVPVAAENNKQMMVYARGIIEKFEFVYEPPVTFMSIFQPRCDNTSTWDILTDDLIQWAEDILKPRAFIASTGAGEFVVGDHCGFCKAKGKCKAHAEEQLELAKYEFREPPLSDSNDDFAVFLSASEIADIVLKTKKFEKWLKAVNEYALHAAVFDKILFPGLKVVRSSGKRMYKSAQEVEFKLLASMFKPDVIFKPKEIWGITEMEKRLGADKFEEYLADLIISSKGSLTLVDLKNKKEAVNDLAQAQLDFTSEEDEEQDEFL